MVLPLLPKVTVSAQASAPDGDVCTYEVVFETNTGEDGVAGKLPLLKTAFYDTDTSTTTTVLGTSATEVRFPVGRINWKGRWLGRRQE